MIEARRVTCGYSRHHAVLHDVSFTARKGETINILGPNGCGKSTLLKAVLGFMPLENGSVFVNGQNAQSLTPRQKAKFLAYVPQFHSGVFNYTVMDVVLMGCSVRGPWYGYTDEDKEAAATALRRVGMLEHVSRSYLHLSGGERQLILIARSLAQGAEHIIMDEPATGLDYGNQFRLLEVIRELAGEGLLFMLTTHHPEHALFLGGRAILIENGSLVADGQVHEVVTAASMRALYEMDERLFEKIRNVYGVCHGMA